jgi:hypothetical protein
MFRSCFYIVPAPFVGPVLFAAEVEVKLAAKPTPSRPKGSAFRDGKPGACDITLPYYYEA